MQKKLMKEVDYSDGSSRWRIACDCHSPDHDVQLWFEPEEDLGIINLNLDMEVGFYPQYSSGWRNWIEDKQRRIAHAAKVLFTGYATMRGDVILDEDGIKAMQAALAQGMAHVKACKAKHRAKVAKPWS